MKTASSFFSSMTLAVLVAACAGGNTTPTPTNDARRSSTQMLATAAQQCHIAAGTQISYTDRDIDAVAGVSLHDIWAVGLFRKGAGAATALLEHFDGSTWATVPGPAVPSSWVTVEPFALAAITSNDVWSVGLASSSGESIRYPLIFHWNGSAWRNVNGAPQIGDNVVLERISADAPDDVWVTGENIRTLSVVVERWNGTSWIFKGTLPEYNSPANVKAFAPNDVYIGYTSRANTPILLHWNGSGFSNVRLPSYGTMRPSTITDIDGTSGRDLFVAGLLPNGNQYVAHQTISWSQLLVPKNAAPLLVGDFQPGYAMFTNQNFDAPITIDNGIDRLFIDAYPFASEQQPLSINVIKGTTSVGLASGALNPFSYQGQVVSCPASPPPYSPY